ncbi:RNA polymerase sigma factor [Polaribacter marinivivus]|uniref:RNA polymerase sigma factor n=1 Tax=Polaribacter marinivivus TaxID=1524260 RepID=UPI003D32B94B
MYKLKDKYSTVLSLYLIEDYNHREIGELLNIKESTVRNQFRRGKQQLLKLIKNKEL